MRLFLLLFGILFTFSKTIAQRETLSELPLSPREAAIESILNERESEDAFEKAVQAARKLEVSDQAILEARFLFHIDREEDEGIAGLLPQFLAQKKKFKLEESEVFASEDDWLAIVEYVQAIAAKQKGDTAAFKRHITEAFWLSPLRGAAFAPQVEKVRLMEAMKDVRVNMKEVYQSILDDSQVTLGADGQNQKAILLHFWSPWSRECEETLSDFLITASHLAEKKVRVVSVLPEVSGKVMKDAKQMLELADKTLPGSWIVDREESQLSVLLKVQTVPTFLLLSPQGEVLYHGHPSEGVFWKELAKLDPAIGRPEAEPTGR